MVESEHLKWERACAAVHAKEHIADDDALFSEITRLERLILTKPCRTANDAIAKLHQCIRGFDDGETGLEQNALRQVAAFLGAL